MARYIPLEQALLMERSWSGDEYAQMIEDDQTEEDEELQEFDERQRRIEEDEERNLENALDKTRGLYD